MKFSLLFQFLFSAAHVFADEIPAVLSPGGGLGSALVAQISPEQLFGRQTGTCRTGYPVDCGLFCCPANNACFGTGCCPSTAPRCGGAFCLGTGETCCDPTFYCRPGYTCITNTVGAKGCCLPGWNTCGNNYCCPSGYGCTDGGTRCTAGGGPPITVTSSTVFTSRSTSITSFTRTSTSITISSFTSVSTSTSRFTPINFSVSNSIASGSQTSLAVTTTTLPDGGPTVVVAVTDGAPISGSGSGPASANSASSIQLSKTFISIICTMVGLIHMI